MRRRAHTRGRYVAALALAGALGFGVTCPRPPTSGSSAVESAEIASLAAPDASPQRAVSLLERRCAVCHSCYDAPCQLLLTSEDGVLRGASKEPIYHSDRLAEAQPTRLFLDAQSVPEWRARGFFPVLGRPGEPATSLLLQMLVLGRTHRFAPDAPLPESLPLDITRALTCPTPDEFDAYAASHPQGGMPYGMAPLADDELASLAGWIADGAPPPPPRPAPPPDVARRVDAWEAFLNGPSLKERVVARYLYEHWYLAHLSFPDHPTGPFYQLLRSSTPPGQPVAPSATRRPYDDPGGSFWYRLVPLPSTIVHKTHVLYPLSEARMARLRELFLGSDWEPTRFPSWEPVQASNPFVSFDEIPASSRYRFLLDDARYFVMTFIRGPVCHGQVATDVIRDRFWILFLDPDSDVTVVDPTFLRRTKQWLHLPAANPERVLPGDLWLKFHLDQKRYLDARAEAYTARLGRHGATLDYLWDGHGSNPDAFLTVVRSFDNASVLQGFVGPFPQTAWVMDYPIFERIYYDLVAGFDVFGTVGHQVATRLYMDHLRMQAEASFLAFLPVERRDAIFASWYVGATKQLSYFVTNKLRSYDHETEIAFRTDQPVRELLRLALRHGGAAAGPPDLLNRCPGSSCDRPDATPLERRVERALRPLVGVRGPWVAPLPELSLLLVRRSRGGPLAAVYSLIHDRAHTNVAFMFREDDRLEPAQDTLAVVRGHVGSYPNFAFVVDEERIEVFTDALAGAAGPAGLRDLVDRFGLRRTSPRFWSTFDEVQAEYRRSAPAEAGLLDLDRYENL